MNVRKLIEGTQVLSAYYTHPDGYHVGAEHDVVYMWPTDRPLSEEDVSRMIELGWVQEVPGLEGDFVADDYDPKESWAAYV